MIEPGGQRVSANSRLALAAGLPTLIVWGERDSIIPVEHGIAAHEAMPNSQFVVFDRAGHMPHDDDPYRFAKVLDRLLRHDRARAAHRRPLAAAAEGPEVSAERLSALDASFLAVETPDLADARRLGGRLRPAGGRPEPDLRRALRASGRAPRARAALSPAPRRRPVRAARAGVGRRPRASTPPSTSCPPTATTSARSSTPSSPRRSRATGRCGRCGSRTRCQAAASGSSARPTTAWSTAPRSSSSASCCSTPSPTSRGPAASARPGRRRRRPRPGSASCARSPTGPPTARRSPSLRCASRRACAELPGLASRSARTLSHTLLPPAPSSPLNRPGSPRRHHVRRTRPLGELREIRKRFRVSPNDVVIATCAGALRRFAERHGESPQRLKVMIPADVRGTGRRDSGNRIAFTFIDLPCDEPDPGRRLRSRPPRHRPTGARRRSRGRGRRLPHARADAAAAAARARPRLRPPATVQPHGLERRRRRRRRATCAAAGCARSTPPSRSPAATRSRSASSWSPARSASGSSPTPRRSRDADALARGPRRRLRRAARGRAPS